MLELLLLVSHMQVVLILWKVVLESSIHLALFESVTCVPWLLIGHNKG